MHKVYVKSLGIEVEVDLYGRIELPPGKYTPTELRKVARDVSRAMIESRGEDFYCD